MKDKESLFLISLLILIKIYLIIKEMHSLRLRIFPQILKVLKINRRQDKTLFVIHLIVNKIVVETNQSKKKQQKHLSRFLPSSCLKR